jgi:hypothetical protein
VQQALTDIAIGGAILTSLLTALDWLLSESQKSTLSDLSLSLWNWLDDIQKRRLLQWLYRTWTLEIVLISAILLYLVVLLITLEKSGRDPLTANYLVRDIVQMWIFLPGLLITAVILHYMAKWLGGSNNYIDFLKKVTFVSTALLLAIIAVLFFEPVRELTHYLLQSIYDRLELVWWNLLIIWGMIFSLCCLLLLAIALLAAVKALLTVSTVVMQRIAESPKGPLFALSAITGGVAALVKTISG